MVSKQEALKELARRELARRQEQAPINPRERAQEVLAARQAGMETEQPSEAAMRSPLGNLAKSKTQSFGQGFADTGGLGFADEAGALIGSTLTGSSYDDTLKEMRDIRAGAQEQNPGSYFGGQVTGAVAPFILTRGGAGPAFLTGTAARGATLPARMVAGAKAGATQGGIYGFGSGEGTEDRLAQGAGGAASGFLVGGAVPAVASAVTSTLSKAAGLFNKKPPAAPSLDLLNKAKDASYDAAEQAGVIINPQGMKHLADSIEAKMADFAYDADLHPGAKVLLRKIAEKQGQNVTLKGLDTIRKMASNGAYIQGNKANNKAVSIIVEEIENLLNAANPQHMAGINTRQGIRSLQMARKFASRAFKLEKVENLVKLGGQQAGRNITDTSVKSVKSQLAKINDPFKSWGRGFTGAEKAAADKAARYTVPQRMLHSASVLNPLGGGKLGGAMQAGAAWMHGFNPALLAGQAGLAGVGYGAGKLGEHLANKSVREFVDIVARGGVPAPVIKNALQLMAEGKRNAITQMLLRAGVPLTTPDFAGSPAR